MNDQKRIQAEREATHRLLDYVEAHEGETKTGTLVGALLRVASMLAMQVDGSAARPALQRGVARAFNDLERARATRTH